MELSQSIYDRVDSGAFKPTLPYPKPVAKPAIFSKRVSELTETELKSFTTVKREYEDRLEKARVEIDAYRREEVSLLAAFREEVEEAFGMRGHVKADLLWSKTWEHGASNSLRDVLAAYEDLVELVL